MRLYFHTINAPKMLAKHLKNNTKITLNKCQNCFAKAAGYRDWFDLDNICKSGEFKDRTNDLNIDQLTNFILELSSLLEADIGDVQFSLSQTNILNSPRSLEQQLELRALLFRRTTIPDLGRRQPGSVGKFKYDNKPILLRIFGELTTGLTDRCIETMLADFEFVSPRQKIPLFIPSSLYLVYGTWTESDGSKVLHSRDYLPLWRIRNDKKPERLNPADWIDHDHSKDEWFWDDSTAPWDNPKRLAEEHSRLKNYGINGIPKLVEILPLRIFQEQARSNKWAAQERFGTTSNRAHLQISPSNEMLN